MQVVRNNDQLIQKFATLGFITENENAHQYIPPEQFAVSEFNSNAAFEGVTVSPANWAVSGLSSPTLDQIQELTGVIGSIRSLHQQLTQSGNQIQAFTGYNIVRS